MTLAESYRILQLDGSASLDEVKAAFRRLALKLHPDLNQDDPGAHSRFQQVNEAYMILRNALEGGAKADPGRASRAYQRASWGSAGGSSSKASGKAGSSRAQSGPKTGQSSQQRAQEGANKFASGSAWKEGAWSWTQDRRQGGKQQKWGRPKPGSPGFSWTDGQAADQREAGDGGHWYERKEEVLGDILRDPFARQVFEEIASQLRRNASGHASPPPGGAARSVPNPPPPTGGVTDRGGQRKSKGFMSRIFGGQLDVRKTIHLPQSDLLPGRKVRITVRGGLLGRKRTLDITLPYDFSIGSAVRLKGLGRSLGGKKGDLYLRILPQ